MKQLKDRMIRVRDEFYKNKRAKGFMSFMFNSPLHYVLVLEVAIADASSKSINFETIMKLLPNSMGSRSTVATVLDDFVGAKYICKRIGRDKRERVYTICPESMKLLDAWLVERQRSLRVVA